MFLRILQPDFFCVGSRRFCICAFARWHLYTLDYGQPQRCFGGVKGKVAAGPMTFARVDTDDGNGTIRAYAGEGDFTDDPFGMAGGVAVCQVTGLQALLKYIRKNGFEHHVAMARNHCADMLEEAFSKYMGWSMYRHR